MSTLSVLKTIIPAGESSSEPIDCSGGNAGRITFRTMWTPGSNLVNSTNVRLSCAQVDRQG
jgi:hypothetical protein